jgi:hypothetical protein
MTSDANAKAARSVFDAAGIDFEVIDDKHWRVPPITPGQPDYHFFPDTGFWRRADGQEAGVGARTLIRAMRGDRDASLWSGLASRGRL